MADFSTWSRENLEQLVNELNEDNTRLREENKSLLDAWRKAVSTPEALSHVDLSDE